MDKKLENINKFEEEVYNIYNDRADMRIRFYIILIILIAISIMILF